MACLDGGGRVGMPAVVDVSVDSNGTFVRGDANGDSDAVISANVHDCAFSVDLSISGTATKPFVLALTGFQSAFAVAVSAKVLFCDARDQSPAGNGLGNCHHLPDTRCTTRNKSL
jgi:hypothetical protein